MATAMTLDQVLWECFRHFVHADHSNAAIHTAPVRYSPLTFRLAEILHEADVYGWLHPDSGDLLSTVVAHFDRYPEDEGRAGPRDG